jgi:hypothetical protein
MACAGERQYGDGMGQQRMYTTASGEISKATCVSAEKQDQHEARGMRPLTRPNEGHAQRTGQGGGANAQRADARPTPHNPSASPEEHESLPPFAGGVRDVNPSSTVYISSMTLWCLTVFVESPVLQSDAVNALRTISSSFSSFIKKPSCFEFCLAGPEPKKTIRGGLCDYQSPATAQDRPRDG